MNHKYGYCKQIVLQKYDQFSLCMTNKYASH